MKDQSHGMAMAASDAADAMAHGRAPNAVRLAVVGDIPADNHIQEDLEVGEVQHMELLLFLV